MQKVSHAATFGLDLSQSPRRLQPRCTVQTRIKFVHSPLLRSTRPFGRRHAIATVCLRAVDTEWLNSSKICRYAVRLNWSARQESAIYKMY